jgi:hypothetical protein
MMSMNGFTLGFFFPKQDLVKRGFAPPADDMESDLRDTPRRTLVSSLASDDEGDRPAPLSLYAYRFF